MLFARLRRRGGGAALGGVGGGQRGVICCLLLDIDRRRGGYPAMPSFYGVLSAIYLKRAPAQNKMQGKCVSKMAVY